MEVVESCRWRWWKVAGGGGGKVQVEVDEQQDHVQKRQRSGPLSKCYVVLSI